MLIRQKLTERILQVIIFLLPTQLGYHFWPTWAHIFGIRVDYFAPTIFLTDIFIAFYLLLKIPEFLKKDFLTKRIGIVLPLSLFIVLNITFSVNANVSSYLWLKIVEMAVFGVAVATTSREEIKRIIYEPLLYSLIFFSFLGILQVLRGQTLGGLFYFLGERTFNVSTPGIALAGALGQNFLRAYSTFPHPNAMAGFLLVAGLLLFWTKDKRPLDRSDKLAVFLSLIALVLTFSLSALICLIFVLAFYLTFKKKYVNKLTTGLLLLILISLASTMATTFFLRARTDLKENVERRLQLNLSAGKIMSRKPILGVGPGGFISLLPQTGSDNSSSWWLQPVHNIYLLIFAETGLVGILGSVYFLVKSIRRKPFERLLLLALVTVLITGTFDHYWLTLQQNQILFSFLLALFFI